MPQTPCKRQNNIDFGQKQLLYQNLMINAMVALLIEWSHIPSFNRF